MKAFTTFLILAACCSCSSSLLAQTATLRGLITDESGAAVSAAKVALLGPAKQAKSTTSGNDGSYAFTGLPPGDYTLQASTTDLVLLEPVRVSLKPGGVQVQNLQLRVAALKQELNVQESAAPAISMEASSNVSAVVIRGSDLDALADDPEDLLADLQALAGPAAGPNGGAIFIDGFSGGQLPPKESIREIRINQNPFSPEYDRLGFGRIEIFTKPGTDKFRGMVSYNWANQFWNSRNPYAAVKAPFGIDEIQSNLSGRLSKRSSFFLDLQREAVDNGSIINGAIVDPATLAVINPYTDTFRTLQRRYNISPRVDYQLSPNNTLMIRYRFNDDDIQGAGIGSFNLVSRGLHTDNRNQTVQMTETAVLGSSVINETRFQFFRPRLETTANSLSPAIQVLGSFNGGGAQTGRSLDVQNNYELQNYTSIVRRAHVWKFGVRLRAQTDDSLSPQNFGGTFTFGGGVGISSLERYRLTLLYQRQGLSPSQIRALGGGATQFSIADGDPRLSASQVDMGIFVGDDWRVRRNLTLNLGLRYETQTNIHDWRDFAPRVGLAWAPNGNSTKPKTVLRAGFGMFYDRFSLANTLTALRYNNVVEPQYVVTNPDFFPNVPAISALPVSASARTTQEVSTSLRAPYVMQTAVSVERQLPANTTVAITYAGSRALHVLRSEDINAPLPGTYNPAVPGSGVFPLSNAGSVFLMESAGVYNQNQMIVNVNNKVNKNISLFGSFLCNRARSNTDGLGTYPANPYDYAGEYGPASSDIHNRGTLGGSVITRWNIRLNPLLTIDSGAPFNITSGSDLFGTTLFNGRPGIATDPLKPGVVQTSYGLLDPNPTAGEKTLPRNYGRGPGQVQVNLRLSKTIGFGGAREGAGAAASQPPPGGGGGGGGTGGGGGGGGGGDRNRGNTPFSAGPQAQNAGPTTRPYNLIMSLSIRNLMNHNNPGPIIGNITSPLFGRANQPAGAGGGGGGFSEAANNRRLELQVRFTF